MMGDFRVCARKEQSPAQPAVRALLPRALRSRPGVTHACCAAPCCAALRCSALRCAPFCGPPARRLLAKKGWRVWSEVFTLYLRAGAGRGKQAGQCGVTLLLSTHRPLGAAKERCRSSYGAPASLRKQLQPPRHPAPAPRLALPLRPHVRHAPLPPAPPRPRPAHPMYAVWCSTARNSATGSASTPKCSLVSARRSEMDRLAISSPESLTTGAPDTYGTVDERERGGAAG